MDSKQLYTTDSHIAFLEAIENAVCDLRVRPIDNFNYSYHKEWIENPYTQAFFETIEKIIMSRSKELGNSSLTYEQYLQLSGEIKGMRWIQGLRPLTDAEKEAEIQHEIENAEAEELYSAS